MVASSNVDNDALIHRWVRATMLVGVFSSLGLMILGLVTALATGQAIPHRVLAITRLPHLLAHLQVGSLLTLGLLVLFLTPFCAVLTALLVFVIRKEWRHGAVALGVLLILCLGVLLASR